MAMAYQFLANGCDRFRSQGDHNVPLWPHDSCRGLKSRVPSPLLLICHAFDVIILEKMEAT